MSNAGFSRYKHFSELDEPLETQEGVLTPSERRALAFANLFAAGDALTFPDDVNITGNAVVSGNTTLEGEVSITGTIEGPLTGTTAGVVGLFAPMLVQQAINANGAISLTTYYTAVTSVAVTGVTYTLADSAVVGQLKKVQLIDDGGDATLTFNGTATIVFADVGDYAILMWDGADWTPIELGNAADGATAPVYTPA